MSYTKQAIDKIHEQLDGKYIFGHSEQLTLLAAAYLSRGHVLIEGPPGTGKTVTAKVLAKMLGSSFRRIQFTTDMLPADILGSHIYAPNKQSFQFIQGPIFSDFIVADEINRTPPRTQSALLEAMEERQVTIEGNEHKLSPYFFVVATQNPQDFEGTFPLPEVQMDRFLFKFVVSHAPLETEIKLLESTLNETLPPDITKIEPMALDREKIQQEISAVRVEESLLRYVSQLVQKTREHEMLSYGSSVRGSIALVKSSRILALLQGRDFVVIDDLKNLVHPTLRHRIGLNPEAQVSNVTEDSVLSEILESTAFPK